MSTYSEDILATSGLQSFWKLGESEGHFADSKGSVNSTSEAGVIRAQTSLLTNETKDKALKYDNSGTPRVKFGNNYQFAGTSSYSVEFWYKPETVEGIADILSYAKANGGESYEEGWLVARFTSGLYIIRKGAFKTDVTSVFESGKTYHIVVTYDGTNLRAYVNGVAKGSAKASSGSISAAGEFTLGDTEFGASGSEKQTIDQLAIYNVAISEATAKAHYEKGIEEEKTSETVEGKAAISGTGSLTAKGARVYSTGATAAGTGAVTSAGDVVKGPITGKANLSGTGSITSAGTKWRTGQANAAGTGAVTAAGVRTTFGKATAEATGSLTATFETPYVDVVKATSGLQSYWKFGEPSGHFADSKGAVTSTVETSIDYQAAGLLGSERNTKGIDMNAKGDKVEFGDVYDFTGKSTFSVELWIKPTSTGTYNIISKRYAASNAWFLKMSTATIRFFRANSSAEGNEAGWEGIEANKIYHVVGTYDGTNLRLYVNGVLRDTEGSTKEIGTTTTPLNLGQGFESDTAMPGTYDELAIYNVALSEATVKAHYDAGIVTGKATTPGTGSITAKGGILREGKANVSGTGSLTAKGTKVVSGKANASGTGSLTAAGTSFRAGKASLSGTGAVTAKGTRFVLGKVSLVGTGTLTAVPDLFKSGKASASGAGTLSAAGITYKSSSASLSGSGSLEASGIQESLGNATLEANGSLTAGGYIISLGQAKLTGSGSLTAIGFSRQYLVNPSTFLILEQHRKTLGLAPNIRTNTLDPQVRSLDLDKNETELILDG